MMRSDELVMRVFLPSFFVAYLLIGYTYTVWSAKKKYGIEPHEIRQRHPIMELGERYRNAIFGVILLMTFGYALFPSLNAYVGPIAFLQVPIIRAVGIAVLIGSLVLLRLSQRALKGSWRVGFDLASEPTELITSGLYARSRNPIYVGMTATAVGLFLALPNAITLTVASLVFLLLQVRILVEEEYLEHVHGEAYRSYRQGTPRWL